MLRQPFQIWENTCGCIGNAVTDTEWIMTQILRSNPKSALHKILLQDKHTFAAMSGLEFHENILVLPRVEILRAKSTNSEKDYMLVMNAYEEYYIT